MISSSGAFSRGPTRLSRAPAYCLAFFIAVLAGSSSLAQSSAGPASQVSSGSASVALSTAAAGVAVSSAPIAVARSTAAAPAMISQAAAAAALKNITGILETAVPAAWRGITARISGDSVVQAEPGSVITGTALVSNPSDLPLNLKESLSAPAGWNVLAPVDGAFPLAANDSDVRIFSVAIPASAAPGLNKVKYTASDETGAVFADAELTVLVAPAPALTLDVDSVPDQALAGDTYFIEGTVTNTGNCEVTADVSADYRSPWTVTVTTPSVPLEPGEARPFEVRVKSDRHAGREERAYVRLEAYASCSNRSVDVRALAVTDVLSYSDTLPDPYRRYNSQFKETAVVGDGKPGYQQEFSGAGVLSTSTGRELDFLLREPDLYQKSLYGQREVLSGQIKQGNDRLLAGDQSYNLSPLLEYNFYGRGAGFNVGSSSQGLNAFGFSAGGVYKPGQQESGAGLGYGLGAFDLSIQGLEKKVPTDLLPEGVPAQETMGSVRLAYRPNPLNLILVEYAHDGGGDSSAYKLIANLSPKKNIKYNLDGTLAGPAFNGSYTDADLLEGRLKWAFADRLDAVFLHRFQDYNPSLDPARGSAWQRQEYSPGINWRWRPATTLGFGLTSDQDRDTLSNQFDYAAQGANVNFSQSFEGIYNLRGSLGYERYDNYITGQVINIAPRALYLTAVPAGQTFSAYYIGGGEPQVPGLSRPIGGVSVSLHGGGARLLASVDVRGLTQSALDLPNDVLTTLGYTCKLPWGHSLDIALHHNSGQYIKSENSAFFSYSVPLDFPLNKRWPAGGLEGVVLDTTGGWSKPVGRVVVLVDRYAVVTDKKGKFSFRNLPAGSHDVEILRSSIGYGRMASPRSPRKVVIKDNETAKLTLSILAAGGLTGRLVTTAAPPEPSPQPGIKLEQPALPAGMGVRNILVEVSNGSTVWRRYTNGKGEFEFRDLFPGKWRLVVYPDNLPQYYELEEETLDFTVAPGQTQAVQLNVVPQVRQLKFVP